MILIKSVLFFILGVACASFFMLLLAPIMWRRALQLANRALRMEVPLSLHEIEAEHDFARAAHSLEICRMEERITRSQDQTMAARVTLDMARAKIFYLAPFEKEALELAKKIQQLRTEIVKLNQDNTLQHKKLSKMADLIQKKQSLQAKSHSQKRKIKELKRQISVLKRLIEKLQKQYDALIADQHQPQQSDKNIDAQQLLALRQEIKQFAAHMVVDIAYQQQKQADDPTPLLAMISNTHDEGEESQSLAKTIHHSLREVDADFLEKTVKTIN